MPDEIRSPASAASDPLRRDHAVPEAHTPVDLGAEGWELPDASNLTVPEAAKLWNDLDRSAAEANKRAARLKSRKAMAKELALRVLDDSGQTSARVEVEPGREIQLTPYDWDVFQIVDEEQFRAWAAEFADEGGESFYDETPRLHEGRFLDEMRRRVQDKQALPPGVKRWTDVRISRTAVPQRRRANRPQP